MEKFQYVTKRASDNPNLQRVDRGDKDWQWNKKEDVQERLFDILPSKVAAPLITQYLDGQAAMNEAMGLLIKTGENCSTTTFVTIKNEENRLLEVHFAHVATEMHGLPLFRSYKTTVNHKYVKYHLTS